MDAGDQRINGIPEQQPAQGLHGGAEHEDPENRDHQMREHHGTMVVFR